MKITFIGTGEAFDTHRANTSVLVQTSETNLLLDCGYSVPQKVWQYCEDKDFLDAVFISHSHADHYFGIPPLLTRMWEEQRTKPLAVVAEPNLVQPIMQAGYYGIFEKCTFVSLKQVTPESKIQLKDLTLEFARGQHSRDLLALRVSDSKAAVCYSTDTQPTPEIRALAKGCDLLIQEAWGALVAGHCTPELAAQCAKDVGVKKLALIHTSRLLDKNKALGDAKRVFENTIIPDDGDVIQL